MRFGIFMAPFHPPAGQDPISAVQRDLELVQLLDRLGYEEAWIGEHHSAGHEIIPDPMIFIAYAAPQTRHIKLGTGVLSLPYHNPLLVADRVMFLDQLLRGRFMLGLGPGALPGDAAMLGISIEANLEHVQHGLPERVRVALSPARPWELDIHPLRCSGPNGAIDSDDHRFGVRRPLINGHDQRLSP